MRTVILMTMATVMWSGAAFGQADQTAWWTFSDGCISTDFYVATSVTKAGKQGPKGYQRYENLGFVFACLPT